MKLKDVIKLEDKAKEVWVITRVCIMILRIKFYRIGKCQSGSKNQIPLYRTRFQRD